MVWAIAGMIAGIVFWMCRPRARTNPEREPVKTPLLALRAGPAVTSIEDRIEQQLTQLDRLIAEADEEITRLEATLAMSRRETLPLTRSQQQQCFAMWESGLTDEEIAACLETSPQQVQTALDEWRRPQQRAA